MAVYTFNPNTEETDSFEFQVNLTYMTETPFQKRKVNQDSKFYARLG